MSVFKDRIVLATDGSLEAERAAGTAMVLSEKLGAELHLVYVEPMPDPLSWPEASMMSPHLQEDISERAEEQALAKLGSEAEKIKPWAGRSQVCTPGRAVRTRRS
jgi:nucleotide-binding universal stress UspA family protein